MFFFFKQKTAYEMLRSLVGSEMCIRDRENYTQKIPERSWYFSAWTSAGGIKRINKGEYELSQDCLLYTSDAADDLLCVDLGGRRIIKKKKNKKINIKINGKRRMFMIKKQC